MWWTATGLDDGGGTQVIGANTYRSYSQGGATLLVDTGITNVT